VVAPDVFGVFDTTKRERSSYFLWQEPKGPDFVLEITSRRTRSQDQGPKRGTYTFLGIPEYFQYDPTGDYLMPPIQGLRLVGDHYEALPTRQSPDGTLSVSSAVLGLELRVAGGYYTFTIPRQARSYCVTVRLSRHGRSLKLRRKQRSRLCSLQKPVLPS
jgi:hypothetical protein